MTSTPSSAPADKPDPLSASAYPAGCLEMTSRFQKAFHGFSKRERACIDLRIPCSGNEDLDNLILAARQLDIATAVLQGSSCSLREPPQALARLAVQQANALLARIAGVDTPAPQSGQEGGAS